MKLLAPIAFVCGLAAMALATNLEDAKTPPMKLGSFTVCLAVKDLEASKAFYEKLDFQQVSGDVKKRWVVVQNGTTKIGLFQGLIPKNSLTFNPGSTPERETLKDFQDVRELQHVLKSRGIAVKIADGFPRAAPVVCAQVLRAVGLPDEALDDLERSPILGHGEPVGAVVAAF